MNLLRFKIRNLLKCTQFSPRKCFFHKLVRKPPWKVLFFGADRFSIFSLEALTKEYRKGDLISNLEIVTTIKGKPNLVKTFSDQENLKTHKWQPIELPQGQYDVGLVVSFGHLIPEHIISKFEYGILNVHASLLPRWRGAAPIIHAIANGDTATGVTIMRISPKKFDIGDIIAQSSLEIQPTMRMPELYSQLGLLGAHALVNTLKSLPQSIEQAKPQPTDGISYAPKVDSGFAQIEWGSMTSERIFNLSRALDGIYQLQAIWKKNVRFKFPRVELGELCKEAGKMGPGYTIYDQKTGLLKILCSDSRFINVESVGMVGKKIMSAKDFNNGFLRKEPTYCRYFS